MCGIRALVLSAIVVALSRQVLGKSATPHFKWGQTKDLLFLSVMVRDLDKSSVTVQLPTAGDLAFSAKGAGGEESKLELPLREDVKPESLKWEVAPRPDKWGVAVLITLAKQNQHRWDVLVTDPKKFKGVMDKDWTREDQSLEPEEEAPYMDEHEGYLTALTEKNFNKTIEKFSAVVVNVRYPWCTQCKSQDDEFAKAAKSAKSKGKKDKTFKKLAFVVVDAREQRLLARELGAKCDYTCEYRVFTGVNEDSTTIKSKWSHTELLSDVVKFLSPAVQVLKSSDEAKALREKNTTCLGSFASEGSPKYGLFKKVAGLMRGELVVAAAFGTEGAVELWGLNQAVPYTYEGTWDDNGTALLDWMRPRAIPLIQAYDWQLRETYERLGLPMAKVWIDEMDADPALNKVVRHAARRVAKKFVGRIAFVEVSKSSHSYELRDYGLNQPELYPAFGIASNSSYNSVKYGFEAAADAYVAELFEGVVPSHLDFWKAADRVVEALTRFCERVLSGAHPVAHETGPAQANWSAGMVKRAVWKTYADIASPERPLLLELYGKYRSDNDKKMKEAENLAAALEPHASAFTVASYDTSENYLPPADFKREKYSSDTEWYWIPSKEAGADRPPAKKLTKPKKDAPIKKVVEFLKKESGADIDVPALMAKFEELMKSNPPPAPPSPAIDPELEDDEEGDKNDIDLSKIGLGDGKSNLDLSNLGDLLKGDHTTGEAVKPEESMFADSKSEL